MLELQACVTCGVSRKTTLSLKRKSPLIPFFASCSFSVVKIPGYFVEYIGVINPHSTLFGKVVGVLGIFCFVLSFIYMSIYMPACYVCAPCTCLVLMGPEVSVIDGSELLDVGAETNLCPLRHSQCS